MSLSDGHDGSKGAGRMPAIRGVRGAEALARFAGDQRRYRHWLGEFVGHGPQALALIHAAIAGGAMPEAIEHVHALKVRTGLLGMAEIHSIASSLEMALRNGEPTGLWLEELDRSISDMVQDIAAALPPGGP